MKWRAAAAITCVACGVVSTDAVQLTLDRRALDEAINIGQSRIESERRRFHVPYRVRVARSPIDWIDVITPFHRVELAAEMNARSGRLIVSQHEGFYVLKGAAEHIHLLIALV